MVVIIAVLAGVVLPTSPAGAAEEGSLDRDGWELGPFVKVKQPILQPTRDSRFHCPVRGKEVRWEEQKEPFLHPEYEWEQQGMTGRTTVSNGLVYFKDRWLLYYGAADRAIGLAVCLHEAAETSSLIDKNLVVWARPANLEQRGSGTLSVLEADAFDSIVLGEVRPGVWMPGSDHFNRRTGRTRNAAKWSAWRLSTRAEPCASIGTAP